MPVSTHSADVGPTFLFGGEHVSCVTHLNSSPPRPKCRRRATAKCHVTLGRAEFGPVPSKPFFVWEELDGDSASWFAAGRTNSLRCCNGVSRTACLHSRLRPAD